MCANRIYPRHAFYPGEYIGNYCIIRVLGKGGFATVYLCEHRYLGTLAAVKVLRTWMNDLDQSNFQAEAHMAASLIHPHIIRVLEFGMQGDRPYLVMDYAPNGTIRQLYPWGSRLTPRALVKYVEQIAGALQYVHDRGLVHRDIKPENLLRGDHNQLLLSDFGISITAHNTTSNNELIAGTAAYMAPELIEGKACFASDQYALGVLVYEWLCGAWPFQGDPDEIMDKHLYDFPPSLREHVPTIPPAVEEVVLKALSKNPQDRFDSVKGFTAALKAAFGYALVARKSQSFPSLSQPALNKQAAGQKNQPRDMWKEISALFALDLSAGFVLGMVSYALGLAPQLLWLLLPLCLVLISLGGALVRRNFPIFWLTCGIVMIAALPAIMFHSLALFALLYMLLLLLSLPAAFATSIHFQGEREGRPGRR